MINTIRRGDIYMVDLGEKEGCVQAGKRPAVVLQNNKANSHSGSITVVPVTTADKQGYMPTHALIDSIPEMRKGSRALGEQITTIDKSAFISYIARMESWELRKVEVAVKIHLALKGQEGKRVDPKDVRALEMCLCPVCASEFRNAGDYMAIRLDRTMPSSGCCDRCNYRQGYDYIIINKCQLCDFGK